VRIAYARASPLVQLTDGNDTFTRPSQSCACNSEWTSCNFEVHQTLWSSGQSSWPQILGARVRIPALPDFMRSSGFGTVSTQLCEDNRGAT
jgi:hypothetical protein